MLLLRSLLVDTLLDLNNPSKMHVEKGGLLPTVQVNSNLQGKWYLFKPLFGDWQLLWGMCHDILLSSDTKGESEKVLCFFRKDSRLPEQLQRAMAAEAEAAREARAKIVRASGEQKATNALKEAANVLSQSPAALQLRYLQVQP